MLKSSTTVPLLAALLPYALAQSQEWGQCGGIGWTGATTCVAGTVCTYQNDYYSQCLPDGSVRILISRSYYPGIQVISPCRLPPQRLPQRRQLPW